MVRKASPPNRMTMARVPVVYQAVLGGFEGANGAASRCRRVVDGIVGRRCWFEGCSSWMNGCEGGLGVWGEVWREKGRKIREDVD